MKKYIIAIFPAGLIFTSYAQNKVCSATLNMWGLILRLI
jgi:hypothetical protein